jgi:hypothetical protein
MWSFALVPTPHPPLPGHPRLRGGRLFSGGRRDGMHLLVLLQPAPLLMIDRSLQRANGRVVIERQTFWRARGEVPLSHRERVAGRPGEGSVVRSAPTSPNPLPNPLLGSFLAKQPPLQAFRLGGSAAREPVARKQRGFAPEGEGLSGLARRFPGGRPAPVSASAARAIADV